MQQLLNATTRQEYVKCGNPDCQELHGPYLYGYCKQDKKLSKIYVGKHLEDFQLREIATRDSSITPRHCRRRNNSVHTCHIDTIKF